MDDPFQTIRPDSAALPAPRSEGIGGYANADLWRAVDELQVASRHLLRAVELLARELEKRPMRHPAHPGFQPITAERAAILKPGERA